MRPSQSPTPTQSHKRRVKRRVRVNTNTHQNTHSNTPCTQTATRKNSQTSSQPPTQALSQTISQTPSPQVKHRRKHHSNTVAHGGVGGLTTTDMEDLLSLGEAPSPGVLSVLHALCSLPQFFFYLGGKPFRFSLIFLLSHDN